MWFYESQRNMFAWLIFPGKPEFIPRGATSNPIWTSHKSVQLFAKGLGKREWKVKTDGILLLGKQVHVPEQAGMGEEI